MKDSCCRQGEQLPRGILTGGGFGGQGWLKQLRISLDLLEGSTFNRGADAHVRESEIIPVFGGVWWPGLRGRGGNGIIEVVTLPRDKTFNPWAAPREGFVQWEDTEPAKS